MMCVIPHTMMVRLLRIKKNKIFKIKINLTMMIVKTTTFIIKKMTMSKRT